jgi:hypothetical protein
METLLIILAGLSGLVLLGALAWPLVMRYRLFKRKLHRLEAMRALPRYKRVPQLLDSTEKQLLQSLSQIVGKDMSVYPKVRLSSLLQLDRGNEQANPELVRFIRDQAVSFVICDGQTQQPVLVVMLRNALDQSEKTVNHRRQVEDLLNRVGLPMLPIARQAAPGSTQIAQSLQSALATFVKQQADAA